MLFFLSQDASELDQGYSAPLLLEAKGRGSDASAFQYLSSTPVQEELDTIALTVEGSTLAP